MKMDGKFLLDTNILIGFFGHDEAITAQIKTAQEILIPSIVIGELYYGAFNSQRKKENVEKIDTFQNKVPIISCDQSTAKFYGQIKAQLKSKGTPIPENDIWVAALSFQHQITLVSRDAHFTKIEGLDLVTW